MSSLRQKLRNLWHSSSQTPAPSNVQSSPSFPSGPSASKSLSSTQSPTVVRQQALPPATISPSPLSEATLRLQSQVWNEAYDGLKAAEPKIVDAYERILSGQLATGLPAADVKGYPDNAIKEAATRQSQMKKLIEDGQARSERVANAKGKVNDVIKPFNPLREIVSSAVKCDPAASTAWAGIAVALDILTSPLSEPGANREGIIYILERAEWYWSLSVLLLDPEKIDEAVTQLQMQLRQSIIELYKKLLLYQMKTVCLHARSEVAVIMRDLVKLDNWKEQVASIDKDEERVKNNVSQFKDQDMSARLRNLDRCLQGVRTDLLAITAAVQDLDNDQRQRHDDDKDAAFLNELYSINPRLEKAAIEDLKGGLVTESHDLVLQKSNFNQLHNDSSGKIIWITGGPGKGKTMFLCGVINQLIRDQKHHIVTYFFCRADRQKARTAKSVLRGLLWLICDQSWGVTRRLREQYRNQSKTLFEDDDAMVCVALEKMLAEVLSQPSMQRTILVIDAIDECDVDSIPVLIKAVGRLARDHQAKWIVSSRTFDNYQSLMSATTPDVAPSHLELNDNVVSSAIQAFVEYKVNQLSKAKGYDPNLRKLVYTKLSSGAGDTFLWAALVCRELEGLGVQPRHVVKILGAVPKGLDGLYQRMLGSALESVDGPLCREILPLISITNRPLTLDELRALVPSLDSLSSTEIRGVVSNCGSFLTVQGEDDSSATLAFIHESAREYLTETAHHTAFPLGIPHQHRLILKQALINIKELKRNMYALPSPGFDIEEVNVPDPDPLSRLRYSCLHWLDHATYLHRQGAWQTSEESSIDSFVCNDLLHWLEVLSLTKSVALGTASFQRLSRFHRKLKRTPQKVDKLIEVARRFILYCKPCVETAPLQVYASAILFCLRDDMSEIMRHYEHELDLVTLQPSQIGVLWSQLVQELPSEELPRAMRFSPDGQFLATAHCTWTPGDGEKHFVEIWDVLASSRVHSIQMDDWIEGVAYSQDGSQVFVVLGSGLIQRLDADSGERISSFQHPPRITEAFFSPESRFLALGTSEDGMKILEVDTMATTHTIKDVLVMTFSPDNLHLATSFKHDTVSLWRVGKQEPIWTISIAAQALTFFGRDQVAIRTRDQNITIRTVKDGSEVGALPCHPKCDSITGLGSGLSYICWCHDGTIKVYDEAGTSCVITLPTTKQTMPGTTHEGGIYAISSVTHSVAWAGNPAIRIWDLDVQTRVDAEDREPDEDRPMDAFQITFSASTTNSTLLTIWGSWLEIWTVQQGKVSVAHRSPDPKDSYRFLSDVLISPEGTHLLAGDKVLNTASGAASTVLEDPWSKSCFSPDGRVIAIVPEGGGLRLWDVAAQDTTLNLSSVVECATFSDTGQHLAISDTGGVKYWAMSPLECLQTWQFDYTPQTEWLQNTFICVALSADEKSFALATNDFIYILSMGDIEPHDKIPWEYKKEAKRQSLALSADGTLVSMLVDRHVWIWQVPHPVDEPPLYIEIPHRTKTFRFDTESTKLYVDGGAVVFPNPVASAWGDEARDKVHYRGYGLSDDCVWITKDNQRLLYLPREFRPRFNGHPKSPESPKSFEFHEVVFMNSMLAIRAESGHLYVLKFRDEPGMEDMRWVK